MAEFRRKKRKVCQMCAGKHVSYKDKTKKTLGKLIIKKDISNVLKEKIEEFRDILRNDEES